LDIIVKGDEECLTVEIELQDIVAKFNSVLVDFTSFIGFRTFEMGMRVLEGVNQIFEAVDGLTCIWDQISFMFRSSTRSAFDST